MKKDDNCRRGTRRLPVGGHDAVSLELQYPQPNGRDWNLAVIDLSVSGLSFTVPEEFPTIDSGETLSRVVLHVEGVKMQGDLLIMHVTPEVGSTALCGALFYPARDSELLRLKAALAGLEAVGTT